MRYALTDVSITCPKCGMTSYNPNDVRERYCGNCHVFHDDAKFVKEYIELEAQQKKARRSIDDRWKPSQKD